MEKRLVSCLVTELDAANRAEGGGGNVLLVGATNRPDELDPGQEKNLKLKNPNTLIP